jgi:hypothetical protein
MVLVSILLPEVIIQYILYNAISDNKLGYYTTTTTSYYKDKDYYYYRMATTTKGT